MAAYTFNLDTDSWSWKKGDYNGQSKVPYYFIEIYPPDNITVLSSDQVDVQIPTPQALPDNCIMHVQGSYTEIITGTTHTINEFVVPGIDKDLYNPQYNAACVGYATVSSGSAYNGHIDGLIAFAGFVISNANGSKVFAYGSVNNVIYDSLGNSSSHYLLAPVVPLDSHNYGFFSGLIEGPTKLGSWPYHLMLKSEGENYFFHCVALTGKYSVFYNGTTIDVHDPYDGGDDPGDDDNKPGDYDHTSDPVPEPDLPTVSVTDSGLVTLFAPTETQLKSLANYLWSDAFSLDNFKKMLNNPMDCILGLSIVPVNVPRGSAREITVGNIVTTVSCDICPTQ